MAFPGAVVTVVMMQVVYLQLASCGVSDHLLVGVAGCAIALANSLYGSATRPAHLYQLSAANGFGQGLFMAAFINLPNEYIATVWPHALAQAKGVPFPLFNLGQVLGPFLLPMMHAVLRPPGPFVAANCQGGGAGAERFLARSDARINGGDLQRQPLLWLVLAGLYLTSTAVLLLMSGRIRRTQPAKGQGRRARRLRDDPYERRREQRAGGGSRWRGDAGRELGGGRLVCSPLKEQETEKGKQTHTPRLHTNPHGNPFPQPPPRQPTH